MRRPYILILIAVLVFSAASCQGRVGNVALMPILEQRVFGWDAHDVHTILPTYKETLAVSLDDITAATIPSQELTTLSLNTTLPDELSIFEAFQQLPDFYPSNTARYIAYKAENPDWDFSRVILYVNIGLDNPFYAHITQVKDTDVLGVLVNKYHALPSDYVPALVELPQSFCSPGAGRQYLREEALEAFEKMHNDAEALGLEIMAYGTYRSIELQNWIWQREVNKGRTIEDVDSLNARGGHSEHHTGLAVDVIINNYSVEKTNEFKWYKDNCYKYGFIIRYPEEKESITGYAYEPWHLRYLGEDLAVLVYESGLTYEEYYELKIEPQISQKDTMDIHSSILVYPL